MCLYSAHVYKILPHYSYIHMIITDKQDILLRGQNGYTQIQHEEKWREFISLWKETSLNYLLGNWFQRAMWILESTDFIFILYIPLLLFIGVYYFIHPGRQSLHLYFKQIQTLSSPSVATAASKFVLMEEECTKGNNKLWTSCYLHVHVN